MTYVMIDEQAFVVDTLEQIAEAQRVLRDAGLTEAIVFTSPTDEYSPESYANGQVLYVSLTAGQKSQIETLAKATAQQFVDEFDEPLDPATTDWDATAWSEADSCQLSFRDQLKGDLWTEAWEFYQRVLVAETERLSE